MTTAIHDTVSRVEGTDRVDGYEEAEGRGDDVAAVPASRPFPSARRQAVKSMLMAEVRASRRQWWQRPVAVALGTALGVSVVAGAAQQIVAPTRTLSAYCFSTVTTDTAYAADVSYAGDIIGPDLLRASKIEDPVKVCGDIWEQGVLTRGRKMLGPAPRPAHGHQIPKLVACTLGGQAAVYPGDATTCSRLGLPQARTGA
jgi:hypothetical protein